MACLPQNLPVSYHQHSRQAQFDGPINSNPPDLSPKSMRADVVRSPASVAAPGRTGPKVVESLMDDMLTARKSVPAWLSVIETLEVPLLCSVFVLG